MVGRAKGMSTKDSMNFCPRKRSRTKTQAMRAPITVFTLAASNDNHTLSQMACHAAGAPMASTKAEKLLCHTQSPGHHEPDVVSGDAPTPVAMVATTGKITMMDR